MCENNQVPETVDHPKSDANRCDDKVHTHDFVGYPVGNLNDVMVERGIPAVAHSAERVGGDLSEGTDMELLCTGLLFGRAMRLKDFPKTDNICDSLLSEDC